MLQFKKLLLFFFFGMGKETTNKMQKQPKMREDICKWYIR